MNKRLESLYRFRKRNLQICMDFLNGMTYADVGARHGISNERVRQILHKAVRCADSERYASISRLGFSKSVRSDSEFWIPRIKRIFDPVNRRRHGDQL